jgi:hypothetical protein
MVISTAYDNEIQGSIKVRSLISYKIEIRGLSPRAKYTYSPRDSRLSANLVPTFTDRRVTRDQHVVSLRPYSRPSRPEPLLFLSSSSSVVLMRLSGHRSRPSTSFKMS